MTTIIMHSEVESAWAHMYVPLSTQGGGIAQLAKASVCVSTSYNALIQKACL